MKYLKIFEDLEDDKLFNEYNNLIIVLNKKLNFLGFNIKYVGNRNQRIVDGIYRCSIDMNLNCIKNSIFDIIVSSEFGYTNGSYFIEKGRKIESLNVNLYFDKGIEYNINRVMEFLKMPDYDFSIQKKSPGINFITSKINEFYSDLIFNYKVDNTNLNNDIIISDEFIDTLVNLINSAKEPYAICNALKNNIVYDKLKDKIDIERLSDLGGMGF